jgi:hypothetical protein
MFLLLAAACDTPPSPFSPEATLSPDPGLPDGERVAIGGNSQFTAGHRLAGTLAPLPWGYDFDANGRTDPLTVWCDPEEFPCQPVPRVYLKLGSDADEAVMWSGDPGMTAVAAGDFNGDGFDDIATSHEDLGVLVNLGGPDGPIDAVVALSWPGEVFPTGDINADGFDDLAVVDEEVVVVSGGPGLFDGTLLARLSGEGAVHVGDVNADGFDDFAVDEGTSFVVYTGGPDGVNEALFGWYGKGLPVGDVDRDGFDDVAAVERTRISLFPGGPAMGWDAQPSASLTWTGGGRLRPSGVGDINGDGHADFVVGTPDANSGRGAAELYLGTATGWDSVPSMTMTPSGVAANYMGSRVGGLGDTNGDGLADFAVATKCRGAQPCALQMVLGGKDPQGAPEGPQDTGAP